MSSLGDFILGEVADLVQIVDEARRNLEQIQREDKPLIDLYLSSEARATYVTQQHDVVEEEKPIIKTESDLSKWLRWLTQQSDLPEPDPFLYGMVAMGEDKWTEQWAYAGWLSLQQKYAGYIKQKTQRDISELAAPKLTPAQLPSRPDPIKDVILEDRTGGFLVRFRYLSRNEHNKVERQVKGIPGRQYHDGSRPNSRLQEPHWIIPGDSISAEALGYYLDCLPDGRSHRQEIIDKIDQAQTMRLPHRVAAYQEQLEEIEWKIGEGVPERIEWLLNRAKVMLPLSEAHEPTSEFKLHREYKAIDGSEPHPYQIAGVEYILMATEQSRRSNGLYGTGVYVADPMGLGKSLEAGIMGVVEAWLQEIERHPEKKLSDLKCLIVCPAAVKINWCREIDKWVHELGFTCQILRGTTPRRITGNFVIVNPQILYRIRNEETKEWDHNPLTTIILSTRWFAAIGDEAHMYKNWEAARTSTVLEIFSGKRFDKRAKGFIYWRLPIPFRVMMSGSPILNRPAEYTSQLEALGLLEQFGGMWRFETTYCYTRNRDKLVELKQKLCEYGYLRREKEDMAVTPEMKIVPMRQVPSSVMPVNDPFLTPPREEWTTVLGKHNWGWKPGVIGQLPPKIRTAIVVPLINRKKYDRAEKDFVKFIEEEYGRRMSRSMRGQVLAQIQILKRLAEEGKVPNVIKWIDNFMEDTVDQKLVLFTGHLSVHAAFMERYKDDPNVNAAEILGGQTEDRRQAQIDYFQNDDKCRLIVCMLQAGGVGITLTAAHHIAFTALGWNPAVHDQAEDRAWGRMNDLHGVSVYYMLSDRTIETQISALIDRKRGIVTPATVGAEAGQEEMIGELIEHYAQSYYRSHSMFGSDSDSNGDNGDEDSESDDAA